MGLLNRFFKSPEDVAKDIVLKDEDFLRIWKEYHQTFSEKEKLINAITTDNYQQLLPGLQTLLDLELSDIEGEEKIEVHLIGDLQSIEHDKRILRVQNLHNRLAYAETKYKYIYKLLNELHNALTSQLHIVTQPPPGTYPTVLISYLKSHFAIEKEVLKQIESRETFHDLFLTLIKGEHIVGRMDAKEKQLLKRMELVMRGVLSNMRKKGNVYQWADKVFKGVQNQIGEYIARHEEDEVGNNPDVDFEYVNHSEFVDFVRQCAVELDEKPSEQMITVFVHTFREWYNNR